MENEPNLKLCLKILTETYSVEMLLRKVISALSVDKEFISIIEMKKILSGIPTEKKNNDETLSINSLDFGELRNILIENLYDVKSAIIFSKMENDLDNLNSYKDEISRLKDEKTVWDVIKHFVIEKVNDDYVELNTVSAQLESIYTFRNKAAHFRPMKDSDYSKVLKAVNHVKKSIVLKETKEQVDYVDFHESLKLYQSYLASAIKNMVDVDLTIQQQIDAYRKTIKSSTIGTHSQIDAYQKALKDLNMDMRPTFTYIQNTASIMNASLPTNFSGISTNKSTDANHPTSD
ncbi:hypothetical protein [Leuconostoc citreum]|uniref:hypothetical protein n=1 Tax=Leuconostoc citreum TaxID=33964 RepID=UPI003134584F